MTKKKREYETSEGYTYGKAWTVLPPKMLRELNAETPS